MKKIILLLPLLVALVSCKKEEPKTLAFVTAGFLENTAAIAKVAFEVHRIDTFAKGGTVWDHTGEVLIERDLSDTLFGFSFYAKRHDFPMEHLYDNGKAFEISSENKSYELEKAHFGFLGKPGGQMVSHDLFHLDSIYKSAEVTETGDAYILTYEFEDDTAYHVTKRKKIIELNKTNFFPRKVTQTSEQLGNRAVHIKVFKNLRFNEQVEASITGYKNGIQDYELIQQEVRRQMGKLLKKQFPVTELPNLLNEDEIVSLQPGKPMLLDFWEVWCSPCIKSFPEVEKISNKYPGLQVVGIVTEDKTNAKKLIQKKGTTFQNLVGTGDLLHEYGVNSYPRYFLIDRNGVVQKEYFGFTDEIEKDIQKLL